MVVDIFSFSSGLFTDSIFYLFRHLLTSFCGILVGVGVVVVGVGVGVVGGVVVVVVGLIGLKRSPADTSVCKTLGSHPAPSPDF